MSNPQTLRAPLLLAASLALTAPATPQTWEELALTSLPADGTFPVLTTSIGRSEKLMVTRPSSSTAQRCTDTP